MRVAYRGTFAVDFSTETHVAKSLESLGHQVVRIEERELGWPETAERSLECDLLLWTSTRQHDDRWPRKHAEAFLASCVDADMPTVALHLDLFWGLAREQSIREVTWFRCAHVYTADGGHDDRWAAAGINHTWMPPAVYHAECVRGTPRPEFEADVVFVGSWQGGYHPESSHRELMLEQLRRRYGDRFVCWPKRGEPAVRGAALNDLYASAKVVVGDSCLTGQIDRYCSDRVFETTGRGGVLVHPQIDGIFPELLEPGVHCETFDPFDWTEMFSAIDGLLEDDERREAMRTAGQEHVREFHTYRNRLADVLQQVCGVRA